MGLLDKMVEDLDREERITLIGILKRSVNKEEMDGLEEQLKTTTSVVQRIAIKDRLHELRK